MVDFDEAATGWPTGAAEAITHDHGLAHPDVTEALRRWGRYLQGAEAKGPDHADGAVRALAR